MGNVEFDRQYLQAMLAARVVGPILLQSVQPTGMSIVDGV
jgi:hypothetical protein